MIIKFSINMKMDLPTLEAPSSTTRYSSVRRSFALAPNFGNDNFAGDIVFALVLVGEENYLQLIKIC